MDVLSMTKKLVNLHKVGSLSVWRKVRSLNANLSSYTEMWLESIILNTKSHCP